MPYECPQEIADLMEECTNDEVDDRPTMKEVYERLKKADQTIAEVNALIAQTAVSPSSVLLCEWKIIFAPANSLSDC